MDNDLDRQKAWVYVDDRYMGLPPTVTIGFEDCTFHISVDEYGNKLSIRKTGKWMDPLIVQPHSSNVIFVW